ncbi:MAG: hypothetical protein WA441_06350 [Methyloceanibacter sp.]
MEQPKSTAGKHGDATVVDINPELDALTWSAEQALKVLIEHQVETLRFVARRTYSNLELMRHLRHCTGWQEIAELQQSWLRECVADYGEEWGRMVGTSFEIARSDFTPLQWLMYRSAPRKKGGNAPRGLIIRPNPHAEG